MPVPVYVLIAACGQPRLLRRTLASLARCDKPAGYRGVIVAENGPRSGLADVVAEFDPCCQFQHVYSEPPNKSLALNRAFERLGDALIVFTDDDVQVPNATLIAYAQAAAGRTRGEFYGGPIVPDYEGSPPLDWLAPFLPRSAAGWRLPVDRKTEVSRGEFIGPNMAAFAADLLAAGGFDTSLGPGRHMRSPGEDTEIQERLLARGVRGFYVPDAAIHHFVREANATVEFALHRAERNGVYWGIREGRQPAFYPRGWLKASGQWLNDKLRIARWRRSADSLLQVKADYVEARWRGRWDGIRLARSLAPPAERRAA